MTAVRPTIPDITHVIDYLVLSTGLAWERSCDSQLVALSKCRRFTYSVESVQVAGYTALVELTPLVVRGTIVDCARAINQHQAARK